MDKKKELKTFISYFFVGGISALVEWVVFAVTNFFFHFSFSTIIAFLIATYTNFIVGRFFAFKNYSRQKHEGIKVFVVSALGLGINLILMFLFVEKLNINSLLSKILSTGIVFFWNFLSRRMLIYRKRF